MIACAAGRYPNDRVLLAFPARQALGQGQGTVDDMMLGTAIEQLQRQLDAKVERHMDAHRRRLASEDHMETMPTKNLARIAILPPPPKSAD